MSSYAKEIPKMTSTSKGWERWREVGIMALGDGLWVDDLGGWDGHNRAGS